MAAADRSKKLKVRKRRSPVDVSKELIVDSIMLTSDVLHSIRNNLPVPLDLVKVEKVPEEERVSWFAGYRGLLLAIVIAMLLMFGATPLAIYFLGGSSQEETPAAPELVFDAEEARVSNPDAQLQIARDMLEGGNAAAAVRVLEKQWQQGDRRPALATLYANALLQDRDYATARSTAASALADHPKHQELVDLLHRSIVEDEAISKTVRLEPQTFDGLQAFESEPITFRISDGTRTYIFRPAQEGHETDWANAVAATRLCEAIACAFEFQKSRVAEVTREDFDALYKRIESPYQIAFEQHLARLSFEDGKLRGSLTEQVETGAAWPIEHTRVWRNWLSAEVDPSHLDAPLAEAFAPMKELSHGYYDPALAQRGDADVRRLARQLSSLIVFDYLTNNWSRFDRDETNYGESTRLVAGNLVSLDHDKTFRSRRSKRVRGRLHWISRFHPQTAAAVAHLERDALDPALFGDLPLSKAQVRVFWKQQRNFERRLEKLASRHGASKLWL